MKNLLIALALTTTAATAGEVPKGYDPSFVASFMSNDYLNKQARAKDLCRSIRDWAEDKNKQMPIKLAEWAWAQNTQAHCIDLVIEDVVRIDRDALPAGVEFEGRFYSELRRSTHRAVCDSPVITKHNWQIHVKYVTRFDKQLGLTEISQESCKTYDFKREKAKI